MRILRRRSNLEVSAKGFALFVAGLVVSTFVGGALRTALNSERVHQRIVHELKGRFPKNEIDVARIEVLLSRGVWPALGLRVHDLVVKQEVCGKLSFDLRVPETVMPVSFWSLRKGEVRLGRIEIPGGRLDLDYHGCPKAGADGVTSTTVSSLRETVRERGIRPPRLEWETIARALDGVDLARVEVAFKRAPQWKLRIEKARARFGKKLDVTAALDLQRSLPFGTLSHLVGVTAASDGGDIDWTLTSELKEGRLRFTGRWTLEENKAEARAVVTQIPLKELATELHQTGLVAREYKFKSAWLTCSADWAGRLIEPFASPVTLSGCHLEGGYGNASLERAEIFADRAPPLAHPAKIEFQHANVAALAEAFGTRVLPAVLARAGTITGSANVSGAREWNAGGKLAGVEIFFSNQSVRGKQVIESVDVDVRRRDDAITGSLDNFELREGRAEGRVSGGYDLAASAGRFAVAFSELAFAPAVQAVMLGGQAAPFEVSGNGQLAESRLVSWAGRLTSTSLAGEGWRAERLEATTSLTPPKPFELHAHVDSVTVDTQWRHFAALLAAIPPAAEAYSWRDVGARLFVRGDGGSISNLRATGLAGSTWSLDGSWLRDGDANAHLKVGVGPRARGFRVHGDRGGLTLDAD